MIWKNSGHVTSLPVYLLATMPTFGPKCKGIAMGGMGLILQSCNMLCSYNGSTIILRSFVIENISLSIVKTTMVLIDGFHRIDV